MLEILGAILLILLTMVSYSSGITLTAKRRDYQPSVFDLVAVAALWVLIFWLRPQMIRLVLLAATIGIGVIAGAVVGSIRLRQQNTAVIIPQSELPEHAREKADTAVSLNVFKRGWHRWSDFAGRMGTVQGRLLMGFFYFIFVTPFGIIARPFTDSLAIKKRPEQSNWQPKEQTDLTLEAASEQG